MTITCCAMIEARKDGRWECAAGQSVPLRCTCRDQSLYTWVSALHQEGGRLAFAHSTFAAAMRQSMPAQRISNEVKAQTRRFNLYSNPFVTTLAEMKKIRWDKEKFPISGCMPPDDWSNLEKSVRENKPDWALLANREISFVWVRGTRGKSKKFKIDVPISVLFGRFREITIGTMERYQREYGLSDKDIRAVYWFTD